MTLLCILVISSLGSYIKFKSQICGVYTIIYKTKTEYTLLKLNISM